ncbi:dot2 [Candida pseudojiufengensis]|uniref:dot2 n=1 Tax=Candida pseudojiufengensis TaxID=497109 RepID=UPI002225AF48|nr:dot2 [Candida pseudojiufengensis]KAI5964292.1 dot2 [Candida pseudojiufengensis]
MNHSDRDAYLQLGQKLNQKHSDELSTQLQILKSVLINFINDHGEEIKTNPEFRSKFNELSQSIGMDPLDLLIFANSNHSNKNDSNFIIGLSVKIVEICQETRDLNGGFINLNELQSILKKTSLSESELKIQIEINDIEKAIAKLKSMGNNYEIIIINNIKWLKFSSIDNLSNDQIKIYELCGFMGGYVTHRLIRDNFGWDSLRCKNVIDEMIMNGLLWVDSQGGEEWQYWEPSWISY